jgi:hypothetical protein
VPNILDISNIWILAAVAAALFICVCLTASSLWRKKRGAKAPPGGQDASKAPDKAEDKTAIMKTEPVAHKDDGVEFVVEDDITFIHTKERIL